MKKRERHGLRNHRLYRIWGGMRNRCTNPKVLAYARYGARGVRILWAKFSEFYQWSIANGYADDLSLDRIDNDGHYSSDNCRWATRREQTLNSNTPHFIVAFGERKSIIDWSRDIRCKVDNGTLGDRIRRGWPIELAITGDKLPNGQRVIKPHRSK